MAGKRQVGRLDRKLTLLYNMLMKERPNGEESLEQYLLEAAGVDPADELALGGMIRVYGEQKVDEILGTDTPLSGN
jgi:hypothetical protein